MSKPHSFQDLKLSGGCGRFSVSWIGSPAGRRRRESAESNSSFTPRFCVLRNSIMKRENFNSFSSFFRRFFPPLPFREKPFSQRETAGRGRIKINLFYKMIRKKQEVRVFYRIRWSLTGGLGTGEPLSPERGFPRSVLKYSQTTARMNGPLPRFPAFPLRQTVRILK